MKPVLPAVLITLIAGAAFAQSAELPLRGGFYVTADTPCGEASNATLMLFDGKGINSSQVSCAFTTLNTTSDTEFTYQESCTEIQGGPPFENEGTLTILGEDNFRLTSGGFSTEMRFCAQSALPSLYHDNDISEIMGN